MRARASERSERAWAFRSSRWPAQRERWCAQAANRASETEGGCTRQSQSQPSMGKARRSNRVRVGRARPEFAVNAQLTQSVQQARQAKWQNDITDCQPDIQSNLKCGEKWPVRGVAGAPARCQWRRSGVGIALRSRDVVEAHIGAASGQVQLTPRLMAYRRRLTYQSSLTRWVVSRVGAVSVGADRTAVPSRLGPITMETVRKDSGDLTTRGTIRSKARVGGGISPSRPSRYER